MPKHIWIFVKIEMVIIFFQFQLPKENHVEKSFSFLLWKLWLMLHNKKMSKDTHVKKSFSFLLWKLLLTVHNKKISKKTHVKKSFSFLLWKLWLTLHNKKIPKETHEWVFCWFLKLHALENVSRHSLQGYVCDILYRDMASLLNESFVDS